MIMVNSGLLVILLIEFFVLSVTQTSPELIGILWATVGVLITIIVGLVAGFLIHFATVQKKVDTLFTDMVEVKTDVKWIKDKLSNTKAGGNYGKFADGMD